MNSLQREQFEAQLQKLFHDGDYRAVATQALDAYGREIYGFLLALLRSPADASDVFGDVCADFWEHLPTFQWRSSLRTWAYVLARSRLSRFGRDRARRLRRQGPFSSTELEALVTAARSTTPPHLKSENKSAFVRLRERLDPEEQTMLILRVDRRLSWNEVARVMGDANPAALRKRFERVKDQLRTMARAENLTDL